jgi:FlaG/FlaF family flagellin (archaellin)
VFGAERGQSAVLGEVLLVGVAVVVAAVLTLGALGFGEEVDDPAPTIAESSGELVADDGGFGNQRVRIYHQAGDTVRVKNVEIAVDASDACGKRGRIVDLPTNTIDATENVRGADIFDGRTGQAKGALRDDVYRAGDVFDFRLASGACELDPGDQITVRVVHTPSGAVLIEKRLTAN